MREFTRRVLAGHRALDINITFHLEIPEGVLRRQGTHDLMEVIPEMRPSAAVMALKDAGEFPVFG